MQFLYDYDDVNNKNEGHIGENNEWAKHTAMTWANNAPLLFAIPGGSGNVVSSSYAEFVDIYPTLADLAGLPTPVTCSTVDMSVNHPNCTEGRSLGNAVRSSSSSSNVADAGAGAGAGADGASFGTDTGGKKAAFGQWPKSVAGGSMGYILHTSLDGAPIRYTEWVRYNKTKSVNTPIWNEEPAPGNFAELYNRSADPNENVNIAFLPEMKDVVAQLSAMLHTGWRGQ